ncbi:MAG: TIGR01777 family protein [Acidobacteria bacterium]|nr:TIGR01777 family protein [Acidobacteriota bacterium]MBK9529638.1 TIGR01777 family protein [Acidobacteriota bacterium]MBP7473717.1 TIGR01777 family oxidoreductase [Pyrinomonadaceae bacterium]MBP9109970.1 TIGR01777 family oxidoreductase [Pyrinomonadaceae bacterium]
MKILITGASGLVGTELQKSFAEKGYEMLLASRSEPKDDKHIQWSIEEGFTEPEKLEGTDAVVHLAGENVSGGLRWSDEKKKAIRDSRVLGTRNVVDAISKLKDKPKVFVASSAIGFYGERGDEEVTESSAAGDTFLADVSKQWESESRRAEDAGIRTVLLRTGIVLSKDGGALGTMLTPFNLGVGGVVGSGKQWMSWISMEDEIAIINFVIENENIRGAVNAVSPNPVTNQEFTKTLGEVLYRPTFIPLPEFAVSMVFGEMGDALLLASTKVLPKRLTDAGFEFKYPDLKPAIENAVA